MKPLKLCGVVRSPIWGGTRLLKNWKCKSDSETVGESWVLTVRADGMSTLAEDGTPLGSLIDANVNAFMGKSTVCDGFPILIKLIDAADRLSVQVHPDDAYAARVENDRGKTEMWYIVEADADAEIICGLCEGVTEEMLAAAVEEGRVESVLQHKKVRAGECYFIPAGLPHAIGKGILIAEIQQNCDLTYRVYDYERKDKNGNLRELHVKKALDVIRPFEEAQIEAIRFARAEAPTDALLADCEYFRVEKKEVRKSPIQIFGDGYLGHLLCLSGKGEIRVGDSVYPISQGDSYLLPASLDGVTVAGDCTLLHTLAY